MKKIFAMGLLVLFFCVDAYSQTGTHYTDGPIVDKLKEAVTAYNAGDWVTYRANFADTARLHINSPDPISIDERIAQMKEGTKTLESYEIINPVYGHIKTAEGVDWGMVWAAWQGKADGEEMIVMIHTVTRYVDGKAVEQWGFWDNSQATSQMAQTEEE